MKASDYKVSFPYGATTAPYSKAHPHSGDDRAMPVGTPIDVGDTIIGLSGKTGKVTGSHLHIQKWKDGYLNPKGKGLADTIAFPARVTEVDFNFEIGNYVRLVDADGVRWSYFHQSAVKVAKGTIINQGEDMYKGKSAKEWYESANDWHKRRVDAGVIIDNQRDQIADLLKRVKALEDGITKQTILDYLSNHLN